MCELPRLCPIMGTSTGSNHICFTVTFSITIYAQPTFAAKQQQPPQPQYMAGMCIVGPITGGENTSVEIPFHTFRNLRIISPPYYLTCKMYIKVLDSFIFQKCLDGHVSICGKCAGSKRMSLMYLTVTSSTSPNHILVSQSRTVYASMRSQLMVQSSNSRNNNRSSRRT